MTPSDHDARMARMKDVLDMFPTKALNEEQRAEVNGSIAAVAEAFLLASNVASIADSLKRIADAAERHNERVEEEARKAWERDN